MLGKSLFRGLRFFADGATLVLFDRNALGAVFACFFFKVDLLAKFSDVKRKNLIAKCLPQLLENCGSEEDRKVLTPAAFSGGFWCRQMI